MSLLLLLYLFCQAESRLNAQNQIGLTPLMESVSYNQREAVSLLIKHKDIDLYKRDFCTGDTALHIAVKKNYIHIVEILLRAGKSVISLLDDIQDSCRGTQCFILTSRSS